MTASKRELESEKVYQQVKRLCRALLSWLTDAFERKTPGAVAQMLVILTLLLWVALLLFGIFAFGMPLIIIVPLYAFYPQKLVFSQSDFDPALLHAWGIGAAVAFLALMVLGMWRKSRLAAVVLLILFIVSTAVSFARILGEVHSLHS